MKRRLTTLTHVQHDREADSKPLSLSLIRRLFTYTRPHARTRNLLLVAVAVRAMQLPALAWVIGAVIGGPVSKLDRRGILLGALGYAVLSVVTQLTLRYRSSLALELGEYTVRDLRKEMFRHIQSMPMSFFHRARLGKLISRFTSDSEAVRNGIQNVLFISLVNLGQMIGAAVFMMFYDAYLFAVLAALSPLLWVINRTFSRRLSKAYRAMQESFSRITSTLAESVGGIRVTQGFVREEVNSGLFQELVQDHSRFNMDAARAAGVFLPLLEFKTQLFI
ncbi:MAG: ABC transporter ATP-binding protein, partial [Lentisphaerae bacterium]|nr:ABC transporter ATP-binding protein [Lentisphaerota bacterium]